MSASKSIKVLMLTLIILVTSTGWTRLPAKYQAYDHLLYAKSDGIGTICSIADPCSVATALSKAISGSTKIIFKQGDYLLGGNPIMNVSKSLILQGGWNGSSVFPIINPEVNVTSFSGYQEKRILILNPGGHGYVEVTGFTFEDGYHDVMGGAIHVQSGMSYIHHNKFIRNEAVSFGGAIMVDSVEEATITDNLFHENSAQFSGGAIKTQVNTDVVIARNTFTSNNSDVGGAIDHYNGDLLLDSNWFSNNVSSYTISIYSNPDYESSVEIVNNMILHSIDNSTQDYGIGIRINGENSDVFHVYNNTIAFHRFGIEIYLTDVVISNNIFYDVYATIRPLDITTITGTSNLFHLFTLNDHPLTSPYYFDPQFIDSGNDNLHLAWNSPAIDIASDVGLINDYEGDTRPIGAGYDIGADEARLPVFLPLIIR